MNARDATSVTLCHVCAVGPLFFLLLASFVLCGQCHHLSVIFNLTADPSWKESLQKVLLGSAFSKEGANETWQIHNSISVFKNNITRASVCSVTLNQKMAPSALSSS